MKSLQPRQNITSVSKQRLMEIPDSIRRKVAPVVRGIKVGNNDAIYMLAFTVMSAASRDSEESTPESG